jgi:hypothetical protein
MSDRGAELKIPWTAILTRLFYNVMMMSSVMMVVVMMMMMMTTT